jgi:hypothetical protein
MRMLATVAAAFMIAGCNTRDDAPLRRADGSLLSSSGGDVALADGSHLRFIITSERYKQWEAARRGLRGNVASRFGELLRPKSPSEKTIARATSFLESDIDAKEAVERTGMTVRDFVLMTVALEQEMRLANGQAPSRIQATVTSPPPRPVAMADSSVPDPLERQRRDTMVPTWRDTQALPKRDSLALPRRDSLALPKRDTVAPPKAPRDTARDTTAKTSIAVTRDSSRRA